MFENIGVRPDVCDKPLLDLKEMYKINCKFVTYCRQQNSKQEANCSLLFYGMTAACSD